MYRPPAFDVPDPVALLAELAAIVPATLITVSADGLEASILPLLFEPGASGEVGPGDAGALLGHLARANPQWRDLREGDQALAIFDGPDAYVSPSLYATTRETGRVVPTWDYVTVHAHGSVVVHDDPAWVRDIVRRLTERHEAGRPAPWSVDDPPAGYIGGQVRAIVGVELRIARLEAKRKLSQNRPAADIEGVLAGLGCGTPRERAVADAMRGSLEPAR